MLSRERATVVFAGLIIAAACVLCLCGCAAQSNDDETDQVQDLVVQDKPAEPNHVEPQVQDPGVRNDEGQVDIDIIEDYRASFIHGDKGSRFQKYIVLHDTEGSGSPSSVVDYWDGNGNLVAAHFVIGRDGTIVQCVPLDKIAHHAGYGDTGHNQQYGITEDGRDDMKGTKPIGSSMADYGMNAWSVGIEMVHVGSSGEGYPEAQLEALDKVIAYIDAHYGFESKIIDHKAWRTGNSDTSKEFARYFENYQSHRTHD